MDFSILLYLFTYSVCIYCGFKKKSPQMLILFLYVFLCFGYMTGSDWRNYELKYNDSSTYLESAIQEKAFYFFYDKFHYLIPDFFMAIGIMKCIYLLSVAKIIRQLSDNWLLILALLLPMSLLFMLINNPLRFMIANIFVNFAFYSFLKNKILYGFLLLLSAPFFHLITLFFIPFSLVYRFADSISRVKIWVVVLLYFSAYLFTFFIGSLEGIIEQVGLILSLLFDSKDYHNYAYRSEGNLLSLGAICTAFISLCVIMNKDYILKHKNGSVIYSFAILSIFLSIISKPIPAGFRITMPFVVFFATAVSFIVEKQKVKLLFPVIYMYMLFNMIYSGYAYIPYSNSIYYIITKHKSYNERDCYNFKAYKERTGHEFEK